MRIIGGCFYGNPIKYDFKSYKRSVGRYIRGFSKIHCSNYRKDITSISKREHSSSIINKIKLNVIGSTHATCIEGGLQMPSKKE
jgi:hypothetical protein